MISEKIVNHIAGEVSELLMEAINELIAIRGQVPRECLESDEQPVLRLEKHLRDGLRTINLLLPQNAFDNLRF